MEEMSEEVAEIPEEDVLEPKVTTLDEAIEEVTETSPATMTRPTTLLKPIRGVLKPLDQEEEVRTASLTPVGHMLIPEKKRGPPPSKSIGKPTAAKLRPVKGTLKPVAKEPVKTLQPDEEGEEEPEA